jgi:hypothetical protein
MSDQNKKQESKDYIFKEVKTFLKDDCIHHLIMENGSVIEIREHKNRYLAFLGQQYEKKEQKESLHFFGMHCKVEIFKTSGGALAHKTPFGIFFVPVNYLLKMLGVEKAPE